MKYTTHFFILIDELGDIPENAILVMLDVTFLFTDIPQKKGIFAVEQTLKKSRPGPDLKPSNQYLQKWVKLAVERHNFKFNGTHFLQTKGRAIGTKLSPGFAKNYVAWDERLFVYLSQNQPSYC